MESEHPPKEKLFTENMIIEMLGLPGAGKTTVLHELKRMHPGIPLTKIPFSSAMNTVWAILCLCGKAALRNPVSMIRLVIREDGRWLLAKLGYRTAGVLRQKATGILVDSGVLQPLLSYATENANSAVENRDILFLLDILPLPQAVIYVDVPAEVAYERYLFRQAVEGVRDGVSVSLPKYIDAETLALAIIGRIGANKVLKVENTHLPQHCQLLQISEQLSRFVQQGKVNEVEVT